MPHLELAKIEDTSVKIGRTTFVFRADFPGLMEGATTEEGTVKGPGFADAAAWLIAAVKGDQHEALLKAIGDGSFPEVQQVQVARTWWREVAQHIDPEVQHANAVLKAAARVQELVPAVKAAVDEADTPKGEPVDD